MACDEECCISYLIRGVEEVYDAFDDFEHENGYPHFEVKAASLEKAIVDAERLMQEKIDSDRREYRGSGTFTARVREVLDIDGNRLYPNNRAE
jgi:hypothetical protein